MWTIMMARRNTKQKNLEPDSKATSSRRTDNEDKHVNAWIVDKYAVSNEY